MEFIPVIIFASIWFWVISIACFVAILALAENEKNFWAGVVLIVFAVLMEHSNIISIFSDPLVLVKWGIIYFALGSAWSFVKWFSFLTKKGEEYGELKLEFIRRVNRQVAALGFSTDTPKFSSNTLNETNTPKEPLELDVTLQIPENMIRAFNNFLGDKYYHYGNKRDHNENTLDGIIPSAMQHKEKIVTWILWWPTSALWTLLNDPLVRLASWIYNRFQGLYARMASKVFAKFNV